MAELQFHDVDGCQVAFRHHAGAGPTLVFLPGYMSDMAGSKASALLAWAERQGRGCLLLDYSGCGESGGTFAQGTLSRWRDEVLSLVEAEADGPVVLVGSSMGGWLMLLVAEALGDRLAGLVGIAAAPDFTEWGFDEAQKARLAASEPVFEDNPYGPEPTPTHPGFWADGQAQRRLDAEIAIDCPVRLIHGMNDTDVPWEVSQRLVNALRSTDVHLTLVKDGDHRLSREADIALLLRTVATI
ncbi:MAG: alpha/beta fold hydrolase [Tsuneonella sp.]